MEKTIAGQPGNENTEFANGLLNGPAAPTAGQETARGSSVANSTLAPEPVSEHIPFNRGMTDIVILLRNGETRYFDADEAGRILATTFLTSYGREAFSVHFGEECHYMRAGKISAAVHMTRKEFFELMRVA